MGVLLVATGNPDKGREIAELLAGLPVELRTLADVPAWEAPEETGDTLEENAILKARAAHEATGLAAVADDTGLEVAALGGRPGVRSARYAGPDATYEDNRRRLLLEMAGIPGPDRAARFVCVVALYRGDGRILVFDGMVDGVIAPEPRGSGGFGYDSLFIPAGAERSFAEMTSEEKARHSHRGTALAKLRAYFALEDPARKAAPTDGLGHLTVVRR